MNVEQLLEANVRLMESLLVGKMMNHDEIARFVWSSITSCVNIAMAMKPCTSWSWLENQDRLVGQRNP